MPKNKVSDEELAKRVKNDDRKALAILVERYQQRLFSYARKILGHSEDARDILQESFLKAYQNIQSFDGKYKFSPWIYRIVHNEALNYIKKRKREVSVEDYEIDWFLAKQGEVVEIDDLEVKEKSRELRKVLAELRPNYKAVLVLYYFEDRSYEEISDILKIPQSTVGVWINRAKKDLKKDLIKKDE